MVPEERAKKFVDELSWADVEYDDRMLPKVAGLIREVVAEERAACAQVAEAYRSEHNGMLAYLEKGQINDVTCGSIAAAIRERGEKS